MMHVYAKTPVEIAQLLQDQRHNEGVVRRKVQRGNVICDRLPTSVANIKHREQVCSY